jgi:signal transduction histidine kinase
LHTAIKYFTEKIKTENVPNVSFVSNIENIRFNNKAELILYRTITELLSNTLQHADAKNVKIDFFYGKPELSIFYSDDGIGFDIEKFEKNEFSGMGRYNLISGINFPGGTINFESEPNKGLSVGIKLKINPC